MSDRTSADSSPSEHEPAALVGVSTRGPVRWIRLQRPEKRNAITRAMAATLREALDDASADDAVRVVVLTGSGGVFSSGADTRDLFGGAPGSEPDGTTGSRAMLTEGRPIDQPIFPVDELVNHAKPTIAVLNGPAVGGGATMAMAADLRVCGTSGSLAFALGKLGLTPEWGSSYLLWRQIGWGRALDVVLTGRTVTAAEALSMGLVSRVVDDDGLDDAAQELAEAIASVPPGTAEAAKEVLRAGLDATYPDARRVELRTVARRGRELAAGRRAAAVPPGTDPTNDPSTKAPPDHQEHAQR
jgi:enoyl-CoA hydratase/carnithine racemase